MSSFNCTSFPRFGDLLQFPDFIVKLGKGHLFNENHSPRGPQTGMGVVEEEVLSEAGFDDSILLDLNLLCQLGKRAVVLVAREGGGTLRAEAVHERRVQQGESIQRYRDHGRSLAGAKAVPDVPVAPDPEPRTGALLIHLYRLRHRLEGLVMRVRTAPLGVKGH